MTAKQGAYLRILASKLPFASDKRDLNQFIDRALRVSSTISVSQTSRMIDNLRNGAKSSAEIYRGTF